MPKKIKKHVKMGGLNTTISQERPTKSEIKKDVSEMTRSELSKVALKEFSKLNKRIKRLEQATEKDGILSPALKSVKDSGGKFSAKGKNLNQLRKEYARAIAFSKMETGTVRGARNFTKSMGGIFGDERINNKKFIERIYETLHRVQEQLPLIGNMIGSKETLQRIVERFDYEYSNANALIEMTDEQYAEYLSNLVNNMTNSLNASWDNFENEFLDAFDI